MNKITEYEKGVLYAYEEILNGIKALEKTLPENSEKRLARIKRILEARLEK